MLLITRESSDWSIMTMRPVRRVELVNGPYRYEIALE